MKQRVRVQKEAAPAAEAAAATNRLTDITVNEVSIVDRAANQRKYLIVKDAPPPPAAVAPPPAPAPPTAAPQLKISPELKAKIAGVLTAAQAKITEIAKAVQTAVETPGAPAPQELVDALAGLSGMFAANPAAPPPAAPPPAPPHPPAAAAKDETTKAGKKISAARLALLMSAKEALNTIIAEVSDATDDGAADDDAAAAEPAKTEKATAAKSEGDVGVAPVVPATTELDGIKASLESLAGLVGKMTQVFEGQNQRIDALAKARGESKQLDLEKSGNSPAKDKAVVWDLDMARPMKVVQ